MVSIGSKALPLRRKACNLVEDNLMGEDVQTYKQDRRKKGMGRKATKQRLGFDGNRPRSNISGRGTNETARPPNSLKHQQTVVPQTSHVRKMVDPETAQYLTHIANHLEQSDVELEERSIICGNALEEIRGKELEIATDYVISHTLQTLLEGCDLDHLCGFLRDCAKDFPYIAMDRSGSHVAETALKSLAAHLQHEETYTFIEDTLTKLCEVIVGNPIDVMCNCHGSHVLRSLLCLCKGAPLGSSEFHVTKSSKLLAEQLNFRAPHLNNNDSSHFQPVFPELFKFLVFEMLKCSQNDLVTLQVDQYSSMVLQTALKLLAGHDQELLHIIPILFGCKKENIGEGNVLEITVVQDIVKSMKETAYSHLMEVILEVAPETLYNELLEKVFRNSLFEISSDHCGNFVVQALVSHARCKSQMELIWEELGPKFKDLLGMGVSGVVGSIIAASQKLHTLEHKCCQALAAAVSSENEPPRFVVPRLLFLESYFCCEDKSNWKWPSNLKMHVMGTLILQAVFRYPSEFILGYINSITSMEADHVLQLAKDGGGARVIEAFLNSNASGKHKRKLVVKLRGHFGELSMKPSSSFTVEKCFNVSNVSVRETIVSELAAVRADLSKTKQGPHLLRKLDVDGYASRPELWKSRQETKQSVYKEFCDEFGSKETKTPASHGFLSGTSGKKNISNQTSGKTDINTMREEINSRLSAAPQGFLSGRKRGRPESIQQGFGKFTKHATHDDATKRKNKKKKNMRF